MGLQVAGQWVWDFWLVPTGGLWHVFFLHAPQTPEDPDRRHFSATVGHATSTDLTSWKILEDALRPGPTGAWDDMATWTGSVIARPEGGWAMLYTGVGSREKGLVQRIGLARSEDLHVWRKHPDNPVLEADPRWYETLDIDIWFDQAWRDPWLVRDPSTGIFHAFMTARANEGPANERGVIGHATSSDLEAWVVGEPLPGPTGFGYLEVPQVLALDGRWHLLFSAPGWARSGRDGNTGGGTFHAIADELAGPYREIDPLFCDDQESLYGGKIIVAAGELSCLAFRNRSPAGGFVGGLTDPMAISLAPNGTMTLAPQLGGEGG